MNKTYVSIAVVLSLPFFVVMLSAIPEPTIFQALCCAVCAYLIAGTIVRVGLINKDI